MKLRQIGDLGGSAKQDLKSVPAQDPGTEQKDDTVLTKKSVGHLSESATTKPSWQKYISAKNLFGIITISLIIVTLAYGFVFTGLAQSHVFELQLGWAELVGGGKLPTTSGSIPEGEEAPSNAPLTVVVKLNSPTDNPIHYILPLDEDKQSRKFEYGKSKDQTFQMNRNDIQNTIYTVIVREGNIPIHFENIHGKTFFDDGKKDIFFPSSQRAYYLEINNLPQNEINLKSKIIKIHYCIHK